MIRPGGEAILVGVPRMDVMLELNAAFTFLYLNKTVKGCWYGSSNVHEDVPKLLDLWKQGQLKLEELISQEITRRRRQRGLRGHGAGRGRPLGHPPLIAQDRSLTSGGTPVPGSGSGAAGRTADPWPSACVGAGRKGSGGRRVDGAGEDVGAGREGFMTFGSTCTGSRPPLPTSASDDSSAVFRIGSRSRWRSGSLPPSDAPSSSNVALEEFAANGYHLTSMNQVAEAAGVTKPVLYQHFRSKKALYRELLEDVSVSLAERIAEATAAAASPRQQVEAGLLSYFTYVTDHRAAATILFGGGDRRDGEFSDAIRRVEETIVGGHRPADPGRGSRRRRSRACSPTASSGSPRARAATGSPRATAPVPRSWRRGWPSSPGRACGACTRPKRVRLRSRQAEQLGG